MIRELHMVEEWYKSVDSPLQWTDRVVYRRRDGAKIRLRYVWKMRYKAPPNFVL